MTRALSQEVLAYSMPGAVKATGLSRNTLMKAIGSGKLKAKKSDLDEYGNPVGVWVIPADALRDFIDGLADA